MPRKVRVRTALVRVAAVVTLLCLGGCDEATQGGTRARLAVERLALSAELIENGDFAAGASGWYLGRYGGVSYGGVSAGAYRVTVSAAGTEWWHVQFRQGGIPLVQGRTYAFSFDARKGKAGGNAQVMQINVGEDGGDYTGYFHGQEAEIPLTASWTRYEYIFVMTEPDDPAARVEFNCGLYGGVTLLDNISLRELDGASTGLVVSPESVALHAGAGESVEADLILRNTGAAAVAWSATASAAWLSVAPADGVLAPGGEVTVTARADSFGLDEGVIAADIQITDDDPGYPLVVPVSLSVSDSYEPQNPYLLNPDIAVPFVKDIADFRTAARDDVNGGFHTFVDRQGRPTGQDEKSLCGQSRLAYTFVRAFMVTGDEAYLEHARHALRFLYDHGYDDGWYFVTDAAGNPIPHWGHNNWWSFQQHYALLGIAAMVEATGGETDWNDGAGTDRSWLETGVASNYARLWDDRADHLGYYEYAATDWSSKWDKGFTPTVDAITTHALAMATMTDDPIHDARLFQLADNIVDHMVGAMEMAAIGFPEHFDSDWNVDSGQGQDDIGHLYKTSWQLQRAYLMDPSRAEYRSAGLVIMWDLWDNGAYDKVNGGPYSRAMWQTGVISDTNKNHWMVEQGVTAGLINYYVADTQAGKDMSLEVADGSLSFFMDHLIDPVYGESFADVSADGSTIINPDKGGLFTAGYHSSELGYYVYLYGNLYYHRQPVTLYYRYPVLPNDRAYALTPLAIEDELLEILAVTKDGSPYGSFDADGRIVNVPAGEGGVFAVTFGVETGAPVVITAAAGQNGAISPAGEVVVPFGGSQTFSVIPDAGYVVAEVTVDGVSVGPVGGYAFSAVTVDHSIFATFALDTPAPTCDDATQNGDETDVDCGGPDCGGCDQGEACVVNDDCLSSICEESVCAPAPQGGVSAQVVLSSDWDSGYCATIAVANESAAATSGWQVVLDTAGSVINSSWNASYTGNSGAVIAGPLSWNSVIGSGQTISSPGFCAARNGGGTATVTGVTATFQ